MKKSQNKKMLIDGNKLRTFFKDKNYLNEITRYLSWWTQALSEFVNPLAVLASLVH